MRPGDLTSSCSSAAWMVLLRAAATPARRRAGLLPGPCVAERFDDQRATCRSLWRDAWRCASEPDLPEALSSAKYAWAPTVNSGAGGRLSSVGGPVVGTPAPRSRPVQPAHRRLTSRCADADTGGAFWSLVRPGACYDRLRSVVRAGRCGPAHAVGAGLFGPRPPAARYLPGPPPPVGSRPQRCAAAPVAGPAAPAQPADRIPTPAPRPHAPPTRAMPSPGPAAADQRLRAALQQLVAGAVAVPARVVDVLQAKGLSGSRQ